MMDSKTGSHDQGIKKMKDVMEMLARPDTQKPEPLRRMINHILFQLLMALYL